MATNVIKNVQIPYEQAFDRLYHAIVNMGYGISIAEPQQGLIRFNTPVTMTDWGFDFIAKLRSTGTDATQIVFTGDHKIGMDLFKVGNKKIEQLMLVF